jgi:hypothetical protein
MDIQFSYEILSVDNDARCMEVLYTSEGRKPVHVGVRIPYEGESLDEVILSFCPREYWESLERTIQPVNAGVKGTLNLVNTPPPASTEPNNHLVTVNFFGNADGSIPSEELK